jgi:hypothetical protein
MKTIKFKLFEFRGGKLTAFPDVTPKKIRSLIIGSVILFIVISLSGWLKIDEKEIWKLYNLFIQQFGLNRVIPRIESEKERDARIELEVDRAIRDVIPEYDRIIWEADQKYQPKYLEKPVDESVCYTDECKSLGGEDRKSVV